MFTGKALAHPAPAAERRGRSRLTARSVLFPALLLIPAALCAQSAPAVPKEQQVIYERMLDAVRAIPIYDNHGHPGFADDADVDAMASPPGALPLRLRLDNPELIAAAKALFDYPYNDLSPEHARWLAGRKAELRKQYPGYAYFDRILDKLNVETMVANRVALGPYLDPKRFRWVFFVDSFLFPFDNTRLKTTNADEAVYIPLQEQKLRKEMHQAGLDQLPATLEAYLQFVTQVLEQNKARGGVGIKFEAAYFRSLRFEDPPEEAASAVYLEYRLGGDPAPADHAVFEDYVFRYLVREAGRLHLAVQIHTAAGPGDNFSLAGGNVLNLENVVRDPRYANVKFVLLHGGYPWQEQAIWLAGRANVYLDSSLMGLYLYPADLKTVLRHWLLLFPEKIAFGSDAFPFNEAVGAEESDWMAIESARTALAAALAEMVSNHEVTEARALELARGYLHDNAARIYGDKPLQGGSAGLPR